MDEQTSGRKGLLSSQQAADYLGITRRTLSRYMQQGILKPAHFEKANRPFFKTCDLNDLRGRVGDTVRTGSTALEALATAQRAEDTCKELLRMLGLDRALMSDRFEDIQRDYHRAHRILREELIVLEDEQLDWARRLNTVTDAYFRLTALHTHDPAPWRVYNHLLLRFIKELDASSTLLRMQLLQSLVAVRQAAYLSAVGQKDKYLTGDMVRSGFMGKVRDTLRIRSGKAPPIHPDNVIPGTPYRPSHPTADPGSRAPSSE